MKASKSLNWKVGGPAGQGIITTGLIFSKACARHGLRIFDYAEYPSLITGGQNTYQVYANPDLATAQHQILDVLVALDKATLGLHLAELAIDSLVLYDSVGDQTLAGQFKLPCPVFDLPLVKLAEEAGGNRLMANNVALGASAYLFGLDLEILSGVIKDIFADKGEAVVSSNQVAAQAGYDFIAKNYAQQILQVEKQADKKLLTMTGNEAVVLGAIAGGLQFYASYPMTPASSILHVLAAKAKVADIVVKHAEDEIGAVNMALGASFAGVRAMTGTSGGGFCYMTEALGLSGVAELPLVVIESMRPGPALGMPTWTAQGDLQFILFASQGEFPRFVFTPSDAQEAFTMTKLALELSEKYQTLAVVVLDKLISESRFTLELEGTQFKNERHGFASAPQVDESGFFARHKVTENGVGERSVPGQAGGFYLCNSYEHDQYGFGTEESTVRQEQMDKRGRKFSSMTAELPAQFYEDNGGELTLVSFGSTLGALRAAQVLLEAEGIKINLLNLSWIMPFPKKQVETILSGGKKFAVIEGNSTGQLAQIITAQTSIKVEQSLLKYDGRPFYPHEIVEFVKKTLNLVRAPALAKNTLEVSTPQK